MKQMISKLKNTLRGLLLVPVLALGASLAVAPATYAVECADGAGSLNAANGADCAQGDGTSSDLFGATGIFRTITNVLLFLIGAVAVIMLIIGGIRYTVSGGDAGAVTSAKNTILYAVVGIIVALLAFAIVNFVLDSFIDTA